MNCDLCDSNGLKLLVSNAIDCFTNERFEILECPNCRVGITSPKPPNQDTFYPVSYRNYTGFSAFVLYRLYQLKATSWIRGFEQPGKVLEVGCGNGEMLKFLKSKGWTTFGVERSEEIIELAKKTSHSQIRSSVDDFMREKAQFDLIILFQVLEHLADPMAELAKIKTILSPNGKIIISVPNLDSFQFKLFTNNWFHLDVPRHLFHHNQTSLEFIASALSLNAGNWKYLSMEHDPIGWIESFLNKVYSKRNLVSGVLTKRYKSKLDTIVFVATMLLLTFPVLVASAITTLFKRSSIIAVTFSKKSEGLHQGDHL